MRRFSGSIFISWCLIAVFMFESILIPPMAHSALFGDFTVKDEIELGRRFNVQVRSQLPLVEDPEITNYVRNIIAKLGAVAPRQPFPFVTSVFMHNSINAFAAPGGYIVVNTGLILAMEKESELASVLAHELAHTTQRHIAGRIEQAQLVTLFSLAAALAAGFLGGGGAGAQAGVIGSMAAGQAAMLHHSRVDEDEADHIGMNYLIAAGYAPSGMPGAFEKIQRKQWILGVSVPTYLSTHPAVAERVADLAKRVQQMSPELRDKNDNNTTFLRIQALTRARYSDSKIALQYFLQQEKSTNTIFKSLALMGKGIVYARLNQISEANQAFDAALKHNPSDPLIAREAGRFQYQKGDLKKAAQLLQRATLANPNDTMALFFYARLLGDSGNRSDALGYLQRVLLKHPEDAEVHETYARIAGQEQQLFQAYLHLTYANLYNNKKQQTEQTYQQAKSHAKTPSDEDELKRFAELYKERQELW